MKLLAAAKLAPIRLFPLFATKVAAGFPSPADDYIEARLDLNELLVTHKEATFFLRVKGDSMKNANINDGDLLVVNRAIEPARQHTCGIRRIRKIRNREVGQDYSRSANQARMKSFVNTRVLTTASLSCLPVPLKSSTR